ncbi:hypothetical protein Lepto7376_3846 [[Leptolyngbya] sp. PCC 7376]|uniref:hypothetical protein n=1 Tax=[Leptolyngbya] sp. PCC 7376 TaxID=111781 RepID=UPI00029EE0F6|nr:hypothetical protein [[Leptolyngbya] sp. PCC 7376]AFY40003.1 hypothetical protein Lepto7376_3846 [[Leptolyngbya] sp. PCC 7376]
MKPEYDFSEARQGAIVQQPANKTKVSFYLDNAILRTLQEQGDLSEEGYQFIINKILEESLDGFFYPQEKIQVRHLGAFVYRLQNLIEKGQNHLIKLREYDIDKYEDSKRDYYYQSMAWLTTVNNLVEIFFQNQDILYVKRLNQLAEKMTSGNSIGRMTQVLGILEELLFDLEKDTFDLKENPSL